MDIVKDRSWLVIHIKCTDCLRLLCNIQLLISVNFKLRKKKNARKNWFPCHVMHTHWHLFHNILLILPLNLSKSSKKKLFQIYTQCVLITKTVYSSHFISNAELFVNSDVPIKLKIHTCQLSLALLSWHMQIVKWSDDYFSLNSNGYFTSLDYERDILCGMGAMYHLRENISSHFLSANNVFARCTRWNMATSFTWHELYMIHYNLSVIQYGSWVLWSILLLSIRCHMRNAGFCSLVSRYYQ